MRNGFNISTRTRTRKILIGKTNNAESQLNEYFN